MSSRPRPPEPSQSDPDLDSTAELPVLDPASVDTGATMTVQVPGASLEQRALTDTDTWASAPPPTVHRPAALAGEDRRRLDAEQDERAAALREAQERLASHGKRLVQLEHARDEALAAQAAAAQRAAAAEQRAASAEQRAANAEQRTASSEQRAAAFERRIADLEQHAAKLRAELTAGQAAAAQQARRLEESAHAVAAAERQAAVRAEELVQARAMVSAAGARAQQLQKLLEQQDSDTRSRQMQQLEQQQAQAAEGRAHAVGVMEDLHRERSRAMSYLESLQTLERRRELAEQTVVDMQREADVRSAELERLGTEAAAHDEHARAQERELSLRAARIAQLEEQVGTLTTMLAQRDSELRDAQQSAESLRTAVARLQAETDAGAERLRALESVAAEGVQKETERQSELQALRSETARLRSALEEARRTADTATARLSSEQAALGEQRERAVRLETSLEVEQQRSQQLEAELASVRAEMDEWGSVLRSTQQERSGHLASIAAAEARVRELEQEALSRAESLRTLQSDCTSQLARIRELESDLHASEEALHRLEADARTRDSRSADLEKSNQPWREVAAEARPSATDTNPALTESGRYPRDAAVAAEPVPDGATRLLIHSEGGREVVHVLGRKTSIGRTPDNDLQLDAKFISRHHAVILVGPVNTVIEDLNSTNGVQVNGRRITRQTLRDGDQIAIGRMQYRFAVRKSTDKR